MSKIKIKEKLVSINSVLIIRKLSFKFVKEVLRWETRSSFGTYRTQRTSIIPTDPLSREDGSENLQLPFFPWREWRLAHSQKSFFN